MKYLITFILLLSVSLLSAEKIREPNFKAVMSDSDGMPLEDGYYNVTFRIYDTRADGRLLATENKDVSCINGTCEVFLSELSKLSDKGITDVWISVECEKGKELPFRTRVFLEK